MSKRNLFVCFLFYISWRFHIDFFINMKNVVFKKLVRAHQQSPTLTNTHTISITKMNCLRRFKTTVHLSAHVLIHIDSS